MSDWQNTVGTRNLQTFFLQIFEGLGGGQPTLRETPTSRGTTPPVERFVAVWHSFGSPGDDSQLSSIQARLFDEDGTPLDSQFQVNTYTPSFQLSPDGAGAPDGSGFLVVWQSDGSPGDDDSGTSVQAQLFDYNADPVGGQLQVNSSITGFQYQPAVASLADGRSIVVWTDDSTIGPPRVTGRLIGADGMPVGDEFQIDTEGASSEAEPDVASLGNDFVVVWKGNGIRMRSTLRLISADDFESGDTSAWTNGV
jgi:hypothetical protein